MKSAIGLCMLLSGFLNEACVTTEAGKCSTTPPTKSLFSSWAEETVEHLMGRKIVHYFFNPDEKAIEIKIDGISYTLAPRIRPRKSINSIG